MITYLFGAGASSQSLPMTDGLLASIDQFKDIIAKQTFVKKLLEIDGEPYGIKSLQEALVSDFEWLTKNAKKHKSVDTYAKKLIITRDFDGLKKLKTVLSTYFLLIQNHENVDGRYDSFFATVIDHTHLQLPPNIRILTWNYDSQFEKAYVEYSCDNRADSCNALLNVYAKNTRTSNFNQNTFGVIKLNGTASIIFNSEQARPFNIVDKVNNQFDENLFERLLGNYAMLHHMKKYTDKLTSSLSFAWEEFDSNSQLMKNAKQATIDTEILIVIGYSFPLFNRNVDREIIRAMKNLKKVYFQSPEANNLVERFQAIRTDIKKENLIPRTDTFQFLIPDEY